MQFRGNFRYPCPLFACNLEEKHPKIPLPQADRVTSEGYYGGMRLLMAICAHLHTYCARQSIVLPDRGNFTLSYTTNIPRQVLPIFIIFN